MRVRRPHRPLIFLALASTLAVAGCNKPGDTANGTAAANSSAPLPTLPATLPMATGPATAAAFAPAVTALPAARPIRAVRVANSGDAYAYADDADAFSHAVGNAPPDYGFDYQGTQPWAWQGYDESRTFVEPVSGGYRYYYYRPGADTPYFVRDPDYGYGYDNGSLAVIYSAGGAILPYAEYGPRLGYASRYLLRGEDLYRASRGNERRAVIAANWAARQDAIAASRDRWAAGEAQQAGWQAYRARVADQQAQHWAQEAARRDADARRFATWHDDGFHSAPPPRAIPAAWQQAPWAQDQQRYRVADHGPMQPPPQVQPAFQRQAPQGQPSPAQQGHPALTPFVGGPDAVDQRTAADAARHQADVVRAQQQQAVRVGEQRQRDARDAQRAARQQQAAADRQQQQAGRAQQQQAQRQQQQADRQALQADRQQRAVADRQQQDAARQADRQQQQAAIHVHRGGGVPAETGGAPRDVQRPPLPFRVQPPHDDQHQADHAQQQAMHQAQQAAHQQEAAAHQQQAAAQHAAQQAQHAAQPPRPAPALHTAPAPHPPREEHGEHRP